LTGLFSPATDCTRALVSASHTQALNVRKPRYWGPAVLTHMVTLQLFIHNNHNWRLLT